MEMTQAGTLRELVNTEQGMISREAFVNAKIYQQERESAIL